MPPPPNQSDSTFESLFGYDDGLLERRAAHARLMVPQVELVGDSLVFARYPIGGTEARRVRARDDRESDEDLLEFGLLPKRLAVRSIRPGPGMLFRFVELGTADNAEIRDYAHKWGPLCLCRHRLPLGHHPDCHLLGWGGHSWWEPLDAWRQFARVAKAMLGFAVSLHEGSRIREADCDVLLSQPWGRLFLDHRAKLLSGHRQGNLFLLTHGIQQWLLMGRVCPRIHYTDKLTYLRIGGDGLFGALAYAITLAVTRSRGMALCTACSRLYVSIRQPSGTTRTYCTRPECQRQRGQDAKSDYVRRKRRNRRKPAQ